MKPFNTFNNAYTPDSTDYLVGYGLIGLIEIEKRWTIGQLSTLLESTLNITKISQASDNYLKVTGSAAGGGTVTLEPDGVDGNADIIIQGKGTGTVIFGGSLTIAADLNLGGFDLITAGGDVLTNGGAINTGNGTVTLGSGDLNMASGIITLTTGDIVLSAGDLTLSGAGTLDINGGIFKTDTIQVSLAGSITVSDDMIVGVGAANKIITTSGITGNKDAPPAGQEPPDLVLSGIVEMDDAIFVRGKAYHDEEIMTQKYLRASMSIGLTADISSIQGGGLITTEFNQYSTVANIGDCATLPAIVAEGYSAAYRYPYLHIIVRNDGANAMDVFPNTSGTIDGGAADAAISVAAGTFVHLYGKDVGGVDTWFTA